MGGVCGEVLYYCMTSALRKLISICYVMLSGCALVEHPHIAHISVSDQKMVLTDRGRFMASYDVSTSKFGVGSMPGSYQTPTGRHRIVKKIGGGLPSGAIFSERKFTGEFLTGGRVKDSIVTRILVLKGLEDHNQTTRKRHIYIHGTGDEGNIGRKASYGCIRMRSSAIIDFYDKVGKGAAVIIWEGGLNYVK